MVGRLVTALATFGVALVLAFAVPVSTLRVVTVEKECCCPDPSNCHCPDHSKTKQTEPSIRACHNTQQITVAPELPAFEPPIVDVASLDAPVIELATATPSAPHPAPPPQRPDAPS